LPGVDFDTLAAPRITTAGGVTTVAWRPVVDGIPAGDHDLRVNVAGERVINVSDRPADVAGVDTTPSLTAGEAVRAVQDAVGVFRSLPRRKGPAGATRATTYADDTTAALTLWGERLAWRVRYRASADAVWDVVVDAGTGKVVRRANLVKSDVPALVWDNYPGAASGGTAKPVDLQPWLSATDKLLGPNVHAYTDEQDDGVGTDVEPGSYPFVKFDGPGCSDAKRCSWAPPEGWETNRKQNAVQAFYLANRFHDHLAGDPIGFTGIGGDDPLRLETLDGAADGKRNNANMYTPRDGESPIMQMYLWAGTSNRAVNGGDDASLVYHEYAHGLSNRLITDAAGWGALNLAQAGAMGEGWSDYYAKDFLVGEYEELDTSTPGDVSMGTYTDLPGAEFPSRTEGLDCPAEQVSALCPRGGYTYGDFGRVWTRPEVHYDGEIWAQTLWDLRTALGSEQAERAITAGMRSTPPEPSFLDARDAILAVAADAAQRDKMWTVFAARGMGYFASTRGAQDTTPVEDFSRPPDLTTPRGTLEGRVTSAAGAPLEGAKVALGSVVVESDAEGRYTFGSVPAYAYRSIVFSAPGYDRSTVPVTVVAGQATTLDKTLIRNWAAQSGGATVVSDADENAALGCASLAAIDQNPATTWSSDADGTRTLTIVLPEAVDIDHFEVDPAEGCGDDGGAAASGLQIETSPDGTTWTTAATPTFTSADRYRMNVVAPAAGATGVRQVRVKITSTAAPAYRYVDLSELGVYSETPLPTPTPTATASPTASPPPVETAIPTATPTATPPPAATAAPTPAPTAAPPPAPAKPRFTLARSGKRSIRVTARCAVACRVTATLTVDAKTARKLRVKKKTLARLTRTLEAGTTAFTLKAPVKRVSRITATLTVRSGSVVERRRVTIKR
jgi:hypothetical protein